MIFILNAKDIMAESILRREQCHRQFVCLEILDAGLVSFGIKSACQPKDITAITISLHLSNSLSLSRSISWR